MKKIGYLMVLALLLGNRLQSQIAFTGSNSATGSSNSLSKSITIPAGSNGILIVGVTTKEKNISSVTFTGTAMNQLTLVTQAMRVAMYYKVLGNLGSSLTGNVVVNLASSDQVCLGAAFYTGVLQSAPLVNTQTNQGQSTSASVTFTSSSGNLAISMIGSLISNISSIGGGQTNRFSVINNHSSRMTEEAGASSNTMSYTLNSSTDWGIIGASLQASNVALDIDLKDFYVNCYPNYYQLNWSTATEKNTNYFRIDRSQNMLEWDEIARIKAAGNTVLLRNYEYQDEFDAFSDVYYRLVEVDLDKSEKVLNIKSAPCAEYKTDEIWIYPNPSIQSFMLNFKLKQVYGECDVVIQDNLGKVQYQERINLNTSKYSKMINHNMVHGFYHLSIITADGLCIKRIPFIAD